MRGIRVMCPDCGETVRHTCGTALRQDLIDLLTWTPEDVHEKVYKAIVSAGRSEGWIEKGEEPRGEPFFGSQSWSYAMFGKSSARSFHGYIDAIVRSAGFDPDELRSVAYRKISRKKKEQENFEKNTKKMSESAAFISGDAPLEERKALLEKILRDRALTLDPTKEDGYSHLYRYIKGQLKGGISEAVNRHVIEALQYEATKGGAVAVACFDPTGRSIVQRRFPSYDEAKKFLAESGDFDPESENVAQHAVFSKMRGPDREQDGDFQRSKAGAWVPYKGPVVPAM